MTRVDCHDNKFFIKILHRFLLNHYCYVELISLSSQIINRMEASCCYLTLLHFRKENDQITVLHAIGLLAAYLFLARS